MRYVGGKDRLATKIAEVILNSTDNRESYLEPFLGGGSTFGKLAPNFEYSIGSDAHPDLIMMWEALQQGWEPPTFVTEKEYNSLKREVLPSPLRGLVGFGQSFGGKWFGGYARSFNNNGSPRNALDETVRNLKKVMLNLKPYPETIFVQKDYVLWEPSAFDVVYADPPYSSTLGYGGVRAFDSTYFWKTMEEWATKGAEVFVSEYEAPEHWKCVAEFPHYNAVGFTRNRSVEKLWHL